MKHPTTAIVVPVAMGLAFCGSALGNNTDTSTETLRAEIAALRAEVARLSADDNWLTEQRSEEIRGLVQDVLADADTRASLLQGGMTAGYDDGFVLGSTDGNFSLKMNGVVQFRFVYNNQEDSADDNQWGFENSRTRLIFSGNVVSPEWSYFIQGDFSRDGGAFGLLDAYIGHDCGGGWTARMGQFTLPLFREDIVWGWDQLAVERSLVDGYFTPGRVQGITAHYEGDQYRFVLGYTDGAASGNSPALAYDTEWAFTGRGEVLLAGNWDQFVEFTSWQDEEFGAMVGFAAHYQSAEYGTVAANELETMLATVDASLEFGGANAFAAIIYRNLDDEAAIDMTQYGFVLQGGYFLNEEWELFGRYEYIDLDMAGTEDLNIFTVGITKYWAGNGLKWTTDLGYGLDEVPMAVTNAAGSMTGWQGDAAGQDGQIVFRTQAQLTF